jgi:hypothetical protein
MIMIIDISKYIELVQNQFQCHWVPCCFFHPFTKWELAFYSGKALYLGGWYFIKGDPEPAAESMAGFIYLI